MDDVRVVSGSVVAGPPGAISIEDTALGDPFEIDAIGNAATLTGSLTRAGGIVARLKATFPEVEITVTPVDRLELPGHQPARSSRTMANHGSDTLTGRMAPPTVLALLLGDVVRLKRAPPVRRGHLARRPARGGHRAALPRLRPARAARPARPRAAIRRLRRARRSRDHRGAPARPVSKAPERAATPEELTGSGALAVLANRPFLLLWLSQAATQIGGNMVLYGLTVIVWESTHSAAANSALILTFLVPAVLLSALAGVYVDRFDPRVVLVATNVLRGIAIAAMVFAGDQLGLLYLLNIIVSTASTFFSPAEAAMIPRLVPRHQLVAANGIFTVTLNAAFALGFALFGSLAVTIAGPQGLLLVVAALYLVASVFCATLPAAERHPEGMSPLQAARDAEHAVSSTFGQLIEGLGYIRRASLDRVEHRLPGRDGVPRRRPRLTRSELREADPGPRPARHRRRRPAARPGRRPGHPGAEQLRPSRPAPAAHRGRARRARHPHRDAVGRRLDLALPVRRERPGALPLSSIVSTLSIVVTVAFLAGAAYAAVAISSQTQLQEDLPPDVRGRVYGVLFTLISVASFVPIIIVGPIADIVGTTAVLLGVAAILAGTGLVSVVWRRRRPGPPLPAGELPALAHTATHAPAEPFVLTPHSPASRPDDAHSSAGPESSAARPASDPDDAPPAALPPAADG